MLDHIFFFYGYFIFFYGFALIAIYGLLIWLAFSQIRITHTLMDSDYVRRIIATSPHTPGVSIIAPAYNEELTIIDNVTSLLAQEYPLFEVIIVNDGSRDQTLQRLIDHFALVRVPYEYNKRIGTKPFRALLRSTNPKYHRLTVVDKENGGTKADPVNAGLNVAQYNYFINTDVDCILAKDAIFRCIRPILEQNDVIAVSGVMSLLNGCVVRGGEIVEARPALSPIPLFQTLEYMRSFLVGKLGWSAINAMSNVSGGYGLFDTRIVIAAGGYSPDSLAEDMDMVIRMVSYCCDYNRPYRIVQIADTCCWTEGPTSLRILKRQRQRWGRGIWQTLSAHWQILLNPKYKRMGMIVMPFIVLFEFLAPIIELVGFFALSYLVATDGVNYQNAVIVGTSILVFGFMLSIVVIFFDILAGRSYKRVRDYLLLLLAAMLEPFCYHPFVLIFTVMGYFKQLSGAKAVWGEMTRRRASKA